MPDPQPTFRALADPTRRAILAMLAEGPRPVAGIAARFDVTRPAIRKHLDVLQQGGLIVVTPSGRERIHALDPKGLAPAIDWFATFDGFWDDRLTALKTAIEGRNP